MWQLIWLSILSWLNFTGIVIEEKKLRLDSNANSITSNKTYLNIVEVNSLKSTMSVHEPLRDEKLPTEGL